MNLLVKYVSVLLFSSVLISCGNGTDNHNASEAEEHADIHEEHGQNVDDHSELTIELNNNEKWLVNNEMKPHVSAGEKALDNYMSSGGDDYKSLAKDLKKANENIIANCTMQGKSHDELHKWLHPHLALVSQLENAASEDEATPLIEKLDTSFQNYHTYFQ